MQGAPVQSAGRRFLKRLGFSLLQAAIFGSLVGLLVYQRVPRAQLHAEGAPRTVLAGLVGWLDGLERVTYDWRARALGARSERSDRVVLVTIDDDTLAEARQSEHAGIASHPWQRQVVGGMVDRLVQEGAAVVLVDLPFPERSPRTPLAPRLSRESVPDDDTAFRDALAKVSGQSVLGFSWTASRERTPGGRLWPYRVRVGTFRAQPEARARAQAVLSAQRPAFIVPAGAALEVWAGVADEPEGRALGEQLGGAGPWLVQERRASDDSFRVTALDLFVALTEVEVQGLEPEKLVQVRHLEHPVAPLLGPQSLYGGASVPLDPDGVVRGLPHLVNYAPREGVRHVLPSLPLAAAMQMAGTRQLRWADGKLYVGDRYVVPMDETGYSLLRWDAADAGRGARGSVERAIPAWNVLLNLFDVANERPPRFDQDLEGRAVVLANTSSQGGDVRPSPIGRTAGGAVLAQSLVNILKSEGLTRARPDVDLWCTLGMAFLGAFVALTFSSSFRSGVGAGFYFLSAGALAVGYLAFARHVFVEKDLWVAVAGPLLAMVLTFAATTFYAFRTERQLRDFVHRALGRYVSPEVARLVTKDLTLMRPERRPVTVYFSDIEGFTRLSEEMEPERLVQMLNEYLTEMTASVRSTGGQVDKYIGDALMAFWGAPVRTDRHAHLACEAALKMRAALLQRQPEWEKTYGHRIQFRAGINSGEGVVGDMGSDLKSNYTVMGEAVNLASRLERANTDYGTYVLVGEATARQAADAYVFREVDRVRAHGRTEPTRLHELLGRQGDIPEPVQRLLSLYEKALTAWHQRRFDDALALFEQCVAEHEDPVSAVYARRCRAFLASPPPEDWDGVAPPAERAAVA
ncbi:adenylate/guanylate cyclase domain-containing protein [Myxococcaceae bacterium GXIMD 01537]